MKTLTRVERFQLGIEVHGYNSDFRRELQAIVDKEPINTLAIDKLFDKYNIQE